ncbi:hypothetical protein WICMUC_002094 [Wickerhamomyces mucosus]|uniref:Uncharacterized protein n=1 Tax=Wickerhamomyces mucosus TaxID=1378264 RepID=A0A9P8PQ81_9ASCO|nr:hypothetical protein WICMUC_002094 [Wickerhamomyces mucosus]
MLRYLNQRSIASQLRFNSKWAKPSHDQQTWDHEHEDLTLDKSLSLDASSLPFGYRRGGESFGQIVKDYHYDLNEQNDSKIKVIPREDYLKDHHLDKVQMNFKELTSQDERLHPNTLKGRTYRNQIKIPEHLTKRIYNHMIALHLPKIMKHKIAEAYVKLNEEQIYQPAMKRHEVDTHIAAFFTQNYGSAYQVLQELFKRRPNFKPDSVLEVGFGPSTGMLALNEIRGHEFKPSIKDSVIIGHEDMQNRAKVLLSRQLNEFTGNIDELLALQQKKEEESNEEEKEEEDNFIGEVKTNKIKVKTKLFENIPKTKKYDLIIAQHQLLSELNQFPLQIDDKLDELLTKLNPNGVLVLVERGTPQGFENIARARQIMFRPENFPEENGKIPRPYLKGSTDELNDEELLKNFDIIDDTYKKDFYLSIIAPCPHQKKCPLQTTKPEYYNYPIGSKKLNWCHFEKSIERPRFLMELKRGKVLSSRWDEKDSVSPSSTKLDGDSGRSNSNNYELTNYSYLIVERSSNDSKTIGEIEKQRKESIETDQGNIENWARIIKQPLKRKGHVTMGVCSHSGELEKWTVTKSFDKQSYHDSRKSKQGDLWGLETKTQVLLKSNNDEKLLEKLQNYERELKLKEKMARKLKDRKDKKSIKLKSYEILQNQENNPEDMIDLYTDSFNSSNRQRQRDKRGGIKNYEE